MRTTLTLDADVAADLERRRRAGRGLKAEVNRLLRLGLLHDGVAQTPARQSSWTEPMPLGVSLIGTLDDVSAALARAEGEEHG